TTANNALVYITPEWQGLSVTGAYVTAATTDEAPGNVGDTRIYVFWPTYKIGNLQISWDHEEVWLAKSGGPRLKVNGFGASYDFGVAKVFGLIDKTKT
ncbi:porin, partial [Salmonella enterica]|uniref:porin n=1 Tax=Salmonella enterica TaxID=28901 RepID=UPI003FA77A6A